MDNYAIHYFIQYKGDGAVMTATDLFIDKVVYLVGNCLVI